MSKIYYYSDMAYNPEKETLEEFLEYNAHEYVPPLDNIPIHNYTTDIAEYMWSNNNGWDWWKQGDEVTFHLWDEDKNYLGQFTASFDVEPVFYTSDLVK